MEQINSSPPIVRLPLLFQMGVSGLAVGIPLAWWVCSIGRASWDGLTPWSLVEFWLSGVLLVAVSLICLPSILLPAPSLGSKIKQTSALVAGLILGAVLVFGWHMQLVQKNVSQDLQYSAGRLASTASLLQLSSASSDCKKSEALISSIASDRAWLMDTMEKLLVRDFAITQYTRRCLSPDQLFNLVRRLRTHGLDQTSGSAAFQWSFQPRPSVVALDQSLAITRLQWCQLQSAQYLVEHHATPDQVNVLVQGVCARIPHPHKPLDEAQDFSSLFPLMLNEISHDRQ